MKFIKVFSFFSICISLLTLSGPGRASDIEPLPQPCAAKKYTLVIDAGHGGADGGAVSSGGIIESSINLEMSRKLNYMCQLFGIDTVMTRNSDISIHSPDASTLRQMKASDLKNRVGIVNSIENAFLISIHQNTFGKSNYRGTHVFYSNEEAMPLAALMQDNIRAHIAPENSRIPKRTESRIYLFKNITKPGILVECGFLTNPQDLELLQNSDYQKQFITVLTASYLSFVSGENSG
ncbi:MAG: N-acetylmuramoyl-L-alanine amidase [Oscillospiraceae bacterium]|nr:N-acetylmuramoyl-L-alanine amidase [Oscillospiraceae bacterium]